MRRIIIAGTAVAVLVGASIAAAATLNTYSANLSFKPTKAGSKKKPVPVSVVETLGASNDNSSLRAAPLTDIKTTMYGLQSNGGSFPTCSGPQMTAQKSDSFCPKKALVATGPVNALLGDSTLTGPGTACNPFLHVWNGGKGVLWFFFTTGGQYQCAGLTTGATAAYKATAKQKGKNLVLDVPLPPDVSSSVANIPNFYGSLIKETLTFKKLTTKVKGKKVGYLQSVACKGKKRPWSVQFTATSPQGSETKTVKGSAKCK